MFLQVLLDQCQVCTDNLCYWLPALQEEDGGHGSDLVFPGQVLQQQQFMVACCPDETWELCNMGRLVQTNALQEVRTSSLSTSTFRKTTSGLLLLIASNLGARTLQGPHHVATKSTTTYKRKKTELQGETPKEVSMLQFTASKLAKREVLRCRYGACEQH